MNNENEFDYEDYFFTKYSSDITDLFSEIKEISNGFCINIFNSQYQNQFGSNDLQEFLFTKYDNEEDKLYLKIYIKPLLLKKNIALERMK